MRTVAFHALLGLATLGGERFLVLVDQIQDAGIVGLDHLSRAFKVKSVCFFSLRFGVDTSHYPREIKAHIAGLSKILQQGTYYSYHYDLTTALQRTHAAKTIYDQANDKYLWNKRLCEDFITAKVSTKWLVPLIRGYVDVAEGEVKEKTLKLVLISRRRNRMGGYWPTACGVDDEGNVANAVETEQILMYSNNVYSFVQVRGSVPVFWRKNGSDIEITRTPEMAFPAFCKHFSQLAATYNRIVIFNLLTKLREFEVKLIRAFEEDERLYEQKGNSNVRYCHFDISAERTASPVLLLCPVGSRRRRVRGEVGRNARLLPILPRRSPAARAARSYKDELPAERGEDEHSAVEDRAEDA